MPSFTSGRPMRVDSSLLATRQSQASAISVPPPMQKPWIAATVGQGRSARRWNTCWPRRMESPMVPLASNSRNSRMSAPAMNPFSLAERSTSPRGGSSARRSSSPSSSISTSWENVLTDSPWRSKDRTSTPSSRSAAFQWLKRSPSRPAIMRHHPLGYGKLPIIQRSFVLRQMPARRRPAQGRACRRAPAPPSSCIDAHEKEPGPMAENDPQHLDNELVKRVQRGDDAAFDLLVRKYQHRIAALIGRYVADWSECQDVAQETFIRAYRAIGNFRGDAQFYTWLHRIAVNTAKNHLVAMGRRPPGADIDV